MSFSFQAHDIAGYQGKEVQLWVKASGALLPNSADTTAVQIRGAQNFNPTEERAESRVSELGFAATKVIYGTTSFSISTSLLIRDLVQIARLCGLDPSTTGRLVVDEFKPINCLNWIKDPSSETIFATLYVSGFKARMANKALAVDANATITLDGSADLIATVDGKATVREHMGDGSCTMFGIAAGVVESDIYIVENPSGTALTLWDGYTFMQTGGVGAVPNIKFLTGSIPDTGQKVKIVYKTA